MSSSGKYRTPLFLQRPVDAQPSAGEGDLEQTWVTVAMVWARVRPLTGREYWEAQQVRGTANVRVELRFRDDLDPTWRFSNDDGTRLLNIVHVDGVPEDDELVALCVEAKR